MTMHMVHPGLTTLNTSKKRRKPSAKQAKAASDHAAWLRQNGVHPDQLAAKGKEPPKKLKPLARPGVEVPECSNGFANGGFKNSVFDTQWKRTYDDDPVMAEREAIALKKAEEIKGRLMPLYNKGPVQLQTNLSNLKDGNGRGRSQG